MGYGDGYYDKCCCRMCKTSCGQFTFGIVYVIMIILTGVAMNWLSLVLEIFLAFKFQRNVPFVIRPLTYLGDFFVIHVERIINAATKISFCLNKHGFWSKHFKLLVTSLKKVSRIHRYSKPG